MIRSTPSSRSRSGKKNAVNTAPGKAAAAKNRPAKNGPGKVASLGQAPQVRQLREQLGLTRKVFSRLAGYSERIIAEWEAGKAPSGAGRQRILELARLERSLSSVMKSEFVPDWLQSPNDAFGGLKPLEVIERGEIDRIWRMIYQLESGAPL